MMTFTLHPILSILASDVCATTSARASPTAPRSPPHVMITTSFHITVYPTLLSIGNKPLFTKNLKEKLKRKVSHSIIILMK